MVLLTDTAQKMKFSIKDLFSKCDHICKELLIWSHLLKKSFKFHCCHHIESSQLIWCANQLTGFYTRATLEFNGLIFIGNGTPSTAITAQKMKFSIKDFFSKCEQIHRKLRIWSHFLKKSLMENFIFCALNLIHFKYFL